MNRQELEPDTSGQDLGASGIDSLVANAGRICGYEQQRIELVNQSRLASLTIEWNSIVSEERRIETQLLSAPPAGSSLRLRLNAIYYWSFAILLALSGFALTLYTLNPFRLGRIAWIFAAGVAAVNPFLVEKALEIRDLLVKVLTLVAAPAAILSLMLLADVRADMLDEQIRANQEQAVVIDDAQATAQPESKFYEKSSRSLHYALLLLAFCTEAAAGLALREAWRHVPDTSEDWKGLRRDLNTIRQRKAEIAGLGVELRNQPDIYAARFWSNFHRAMLANAVRSALTKVLLLPVAIAVLAGSWVHAQVREDMVIAIDLTASVSVNGPDGKSEFQKNVDGVSRVLAQTSAGSRITVIGITDHSFAQPYILLSARTGADPGYFGERLATARNELVRIWKTKTAQLDPHFRRTDILGALELAGQVFAEQPGSAKRVLIIFSDMRQNAPELNLEASPLVSPRSSAANRIVATPDLRAVSVTVLGADAAGRSSSYWRSLAEFWVDYFQRAGAECESYSVLRDLPAQH